VDNRRGCGQRRSTRVNAEPDRDAPVHCWRRAVICPTVRIVDPDRTPDADATNPPVASKRTPAPRPSRATAERARAAEPAAAPTAEIEVDATARPIVRSRPTAAATEPHPAVDARPPVDPRPVVDPRSAAEPDRPAAVAEPTVPTNIYRARRPAVAVFLVIPAVGVGLLLIHALAIAAFGKVFLINGVVASSLALAALPLLVAGLYGLITGAAHGAEHWGFKVWARPPLAYLVVGLVFVVSAALAVR
jgi:hypothetical protein